MSLEEELTINQFGQGVRSVSDLLDQFSQLDKGQQRDRFFNLYCQVWDSTLTDSDVEQALTDCSLTASDAIYSYLNLRRLTAGFKIVLCIPSTGNPPDGSLAKPYMVLLHLFRIDYQRRFALEKDNPTTWWYWDLSNSEVAQGILTRHTEFVDEVYTLSTFRSEFVSLAKLWYTKHRLTKTQSQEPDPKHQTHFDFLTYDETVDESLKSMIDKDSHAIRLLCDSITNALSVRYGLSPEQARKLLFAVVDRHLQETYNTGLFSHLD